MNVENMCKYSFSQLSEGIISNKLFECKYSFSQFGEDVLVSQLFNGINKGFYLDIGCNHPALNNNTYLLYLRGWRGINLDPSEALVPLYKQFRSEDLFFPYAVTDKNDTLIFYFFGGWDGRNTFLTKRADVISKHINIIPEEKVIPTYTLNQIIDSTIYTNRRIDFLNIDVEGMELSVLKSLDFERYCPQLIACEITDVESGRRLNVSQIQQSNIYFFLKKRHYVLEYIIGHTSFFRNENSTSCYVR